MSGIIVELLLSWLLLWVIVKKHLAVLGFMPTASRGTQLLVGFFIAAISCAVYHLLQTYGSGNRFLLNENYSLQQFFDACWYTLKSVLYEELIFRGAMLYITIQKLGMKKAVVLSAVCFGIYHWFSYNLWNNPVQMIIVFLMTAIFGLALAYAFAKTKSLYLPVGLHLGWNLLHTVIFSGGPLGKQLFIYTNTQHLQGTASLFVFLFQVLAVPVFTFLYLKKFAKVTKA